MNRRQSSDEPDSLDRVSVPTELNQLSPTHGIPKTFSLKRSVSFSGASCDNAVDVEDIDVTNTRESSVTPNQPRNEGASLIGRMWAEPTADCWTKLRPLGNRDQVLRPLSFR